MNRREITIDTPCGADWSQMSATTARARLCAECNKVVHDLSAMTEGEVRATVGAGPVCVRYLYDVHGRVLLGGAPEGAQVVPASALLRQAARSRWLAAAALAATAIVFEACGGADGGRGSLDQSDASSPPPSAPTPGHAAAMPSVGDGGEGGDGGDGGDAGAEADADADASM